MMDEEDAEELRALTQAMLDAAKAEVKLRKAILAGLPKRRRGRPAGKSTADQPRQSRMAATKAMIFQQLYKHEQAKQGKPPKGVPARVTDEAIDKACELYPKARKSRVRELVRLKEGIRIKVFD